MYLFKYVLALLAPLACGQAITILSGSATDAGFGGISCASFPAPGWSCPYTDAGLPAPYTTLRYGAAVSYAIPVPSGLYAGSLVFVEPNKTGPGQRLMTVTIQGQGSPSIDVFARAGGLDKPYIFPFLAVADSGVLNIVVTAQAGNAIISAINIDPPFITAQNGYAGQFAMVERWDCNGSGAGWNCAGMQMLKLTLPNGSVLGPYVVMPASSTIAANGGWQPLPLSSADPSPP